VTKKISRILVTGGVGFVGSHIVDRLVSERRRVWVLDDLSSGKIDNLRTHMSKTAINFLRGDVRNRQLVDELIPNVEAIIHLAAITDYDACLENPKLANDVNANGTLTLLEVARRHDIKRFIYTSSAAIYGEAARLPISEESEPAPVSPYGVSKLLGERYCLEYDRSYNLKTVCLRYFNIFGLRQSSRQYGGVITEFMKRLRQGKPPIIYGNGLQTRDFVSITDVVEATILALDSDSAHGVYNVATGKETSINTLARELIEISGQASLTPLYASARQADVKRSVADISKAKTQLHYNPKTNLRHDLHDLYCRFDQLSVTGSYIKDQTDVM